MPNGHIQSLIEKSRILTSAERMYWLTSLPKMTPDQVAKLETILNKASQIPWTDHVQRYFTLITHAAERVFV